ncbi:MAG: nicotinate-nucleotide adenylyltransferase [Methylophilaceae bacterium]
MRVTGLLGGTFNPIHFGHLRMAQELANSLQLDEVRFIPSANPPHKSTPEVSAKHRAEMVKVAIADNPLFKLDEREMQREGASYTIDTLISLREELGSKTAICLFMGSDAFIHLNTWHRWQELLDYCHIVLVQRPNLSAEHPKLPEALETLLHEHYTENTIDLATKSAGLVHMQKITALDISSTKIRTMLQNRESPRYLMPENILTFIQQHQLYSTI